MSRAAEKYIDGVMSGDILVSATTKLTFERHVKDLRMAPEQGWYFDKKAVKKVLDFCTLLKHSPDKRNIVSFKPDPWQEAIIYILFGWHNKNGKRRFKNAYIEIPKKNGKTTFAAVFANYFLFFDGEEDAEVYCAASVEKQARICFDMAKKMVKRSPSLMSRAHILTKNISYIDKSSKMEPLGRDSDSMEGINVSAGIVDEYHIWKDRQVLLNMQSASVARAQPMIVIITTSGIDKTGPCFEDRGLMIDILKGIKSQPDTFAIIYTIDEHDDWKDQSIWLKANPSIGLPGAVSMGGLFDEFQKALNSPSKEVDFKTKHLNLWVDAPTVWIPDEKWMKCRHEITIEDLTGKPCYAGLDLANSVDLNALLLFFPDIKGHPVLKADFWIPEDKVHEKEDRVDYRDWTQRGLIKVTGGGIIDIDEQSEDIMHILKQYRTELFSYDPYLAHHGVIQNLEKMGFPVSKMLQVPQSLKNLSMPTKEYQRLVISGELEHMGNPVLRWMMRNVVILMDTNENIKPDKKRCREKIDGIMAAITAIAGWQFVTTDKSNIIYKDHDLRSVKMW